MGKGSRHADRNLIGPSARPLFAVLIKEKMSSEPAADTSDAFVAFQMETGKLAWFRQMTAGDTFNVGCEIAAPVNCPQVKGPDFDFGSSPNLVELKNGKRALIAGQKSGVVHAIDPDQQGKVLWQTRVGRGGSLGGVQWGSAVDADNIDVAVSDAVVRVVPERTAGAQKPEYGEGNVRLDPNAGGGLYALKLETGEVVWHTPRIRGVAVRLAVARRNRRP
jgi:polyvinyl alcohol dehydrogenase (cytochrome)